MTDDRAASNLHAEEQLFQALLESTPYAIVVIDQDGRIVIVNEETERLFGYTREELIGHSEEMLMPERFRASHRTHRANYIATPYRRPMGVCLELFGRRKDGREFPVDVVLSPVNTENGILITSLIIDITERKLAEEALERQTQELRRSNEDLEQFAHIASHDLQEPLRKIRVFSNLLDGEIGDRLSEETRGFLARIQNATERMQTLIDELLAYSRVTTQGQQRQPIDLGAVASEVISDLEIQLAQSGGQVILYDLPIVKADPLQMRQLLQNLVGNALKFRRLNHPPVVRVFGRPLDGSYCEIVVEDNGIGIEKQAQDRIFGLFQRLHGRSEYEGSGIGLAICRRIVERHGGHIRVESVVNQSTRFIATLPVGTLEG